MGELPQNQSGNQYQAPTSYQNGVLPAGLPLISPEAQQT